MKAGRGGMDERPQGEATGQRGQQGQRRALSPNHVRLQGARHGARAAGQEGESEELMHPFWNVTSDGHKNNSFPSKRRHTGDK